MTRPLEGTLVVSLEQAVAAPFCSSRLADAGARVIKIERAEGDFARGYDSAVHGESTYFVWLNRGKESLVLDIKEPGDAALLHRIIGKADVFIQNLAPGAAARAGLDFAVLETDIAANGTADGAEIEENARALEASGHWGTPTCVLEGEPFFGQDRYDQLVWRLEQRGLRQR